VHLAGRGVNFQPHPSQDEWAWIFESGPSTCTTPASSSGKGSEVGWVAPEYGANLTCPASNVKEATQLARLILVLSDIQRSGPPAKSLGPFLL